MADDSVNNVEMFNDSYDSESKTSAKIAALQQENRQLVNENDLIKERVEKLKKSIDDSNNEKAELLKMVEESEFETRALRSITTRVAELEEEASQLQDHLGKAFNDLEESSSEASLLRSTVVGLKSSENEKEIKIQAIEEEKKLLILKVEKLEASKDDQKVEKEAKELHIRALKNKLQDWDKEKAELAKKEMEARVDEMKGRVLEIEKKLKDKELLIADDHTNGIPVAEGKNYGFKLEWPLVIGSAVAAIALATTVIYLRNARKT
ncbi:PREDICTED: protein Hook homolog 1-like [Ipomoea nil]|uniref:protein Hook homolog 1-like n=1 Tax=Ipomoea nil TaxID=35883 RepID=UPI000901C968|nr:PREDICTED: protein Hook homolog 1-like [Ipomoea nil]XP_019193496.1 PREDICTED: protein Hook homolog 1-like [Ipomoea nil]